MTLRTCILIGAAVLLLAWVALLDRLGCLR